MKLFPQLVCDSGGFGFYKKQTAESAKSTTFSATASLYHAYLTRILFEPIDYMVDAYTNVVVCLFYHFASLSSHLKRTLLCHLTFF